MADQDKLKRVFVCAVGKIKYTRMPLGSKEAPATFQKLVVILQANSRDYARAYLDNIMTFRGSWEDYMTYKDQVMSQTGGSRPDSKREEIPNQHGE